GTRRAGKPIIHSVHDGIQAGVVNVVQHVIGFQAELQASPLRQSERSSEGEIETHQPGTRDRIASCVSVNPSWWRSECVQVEEAAVPLNGQPGGFGASAPDTSGLSQPLCVAQYPRREGIPSLCCQAPAQLPVL